MNYFLSYVSANTANTSSIDWKGWSFQTHPKEPRPHPPRSGCFCVVVFLLNIRLGIRVNRSLSTSKMAALRGWSHNLSSRFLWSDAAGPLCAHLRASSTVLRSVKPHGSFPELLSHVKRAHQQAAVCAIVRDVFALSQREVMGSYNEGEGAGEGGSGDGGARVCTITALWSRLFFFFFSFFFCMRKNWPGSCVPGLSDISSTSSSRPSKLSPMV